MSMPSARSGFWKFRGYALLAAHRPGIFDAQPDARKSIATSLLWTASFFCVTAVFMLILWVCQLLVG